MQSDGVVSASDVHAHPFAEPAPIALAQGLDRLAAWATPLRLAVFQTLAAAMLAGIGLAAPEPRPGFHGLYNDTNGIGAYLRLDLWRQNLGWPGGRQTLFNLHPALYVWSLRGAFVALAVLQLVALLACLRGPEESRRSPWPWLLGPALTSLAIQIYPPLCSDVFYYATSANVANTGGNPYLRPLGTFITDPLLAYNDWLDIASPYGPLWTDISRGVIAVTGANPTAAVLAFRAIAVITAFGLAGVTYAFARRLTGDRRLTIAALVLVAWQPVLLFESAAGAHNDAAMMLLAMGGLLLITSERRGTTRAGLLLIAASVLFKYATLPMLAFAALWRLRRITSRASLRTIVAQWLLDLLAVATLAVVAFAPYWIGPRTLGALPAEPGRAVAGTVWLLPQSAIAVALGWDAADWFTTAAGHIAVASLVVLVLVLVRWLTGVMWQPDRAGGGIAAIAVRRRPLASQAVAWTVMAGGLAFIPINAPVWYGIWPMAPLVLGWVIWAAGPAPRRARQSDRSIAELRTDGPLVPLWLLLFFGWSFLNWLVYHTRVIG